jgi:hypothetical protein
MVIESEENKSATGNEEQKDIFMTWTDSYKAVSKMWEDSYQTLYKPWLEATKELYEKAAEISTDAAPQKYQEFYDDWMKTYQNTFGKFYPMPMPESTKEMLEKFMASAEESNRIYRSWIAELEDNSQKTRKIRDFLISSGIAKFTINFTNIDCNQSKTQKIIKSLYLDYVTLDSYSICCHRFRSKQGIWFNMV